MSARAQQPCDDLAAKVAAIDLLVQTLARNNQELRAKVGELEQQRGAATAFMQEWVRLKAADRGQFTYEAVRRWAETGVIVAEKRAGRWFVNKSSLAAYLAQLSAA